MAQAKGLSITATWIIISTVLIGTGLGLYFLLRKPKEEESTEDTESTDDGSSSSSSSSSSSEKIKIEKPSWVDAKKFQTWMDDNHPYFYKDTDGKYKNFCKATTGHDRVAKVCGGWGEQTQKAWNKYSKGYGEYVKTKMAEQKQSKETYEWVKNLNS